MLKINVKGGEYFDDDTQQFINVKDTTLSLEHSLISIKNWEAKWHIPFLHTEQLTREQILDYIKCMTITRDVKDEVYKCITEDHISEITEYMKDPMTATWFNDNKIIGNKIGTNEIITAEIVYYWMIILNIPAEYQKWNIQQLLTLIRVINAKSEPEKKQEINRDWLVDRSNLNERRKKELGITD